MKKTLLLVPIAALLVAGCTRSTVSNPTPSPTTDPNATPMELSDMVPGVTPEPAEGVVVGGAIMSPNETLIENARQSADHQILVQAVEAAGLVDTLETNGPFTIFAPTDSAFEKLPTGTLENLLKPANKSQLTKILTYHAVPARYTADDLEDGLKLKTIQGQELTVIEDDGDWYIQDSNGDRAMIEISDVPSSNGITFVIDTVLMPK